MKNSIVLLCFLTLGCAMQNVKPNLDIKCIEGVSLFPKLDSLGNVIDYDTAKVKIYSLKKYRLYEFEYLNIIFGQNGISKSRRKHFTLFNIDSAYGYDFDTSQLPIKRKIKVDSSMRREWIVSNRIYPIVSNNIGQIASKTFNKDSGTMHINYRILNSSDSSFLGLLNLHFTSHFVKTEITLSREFDSLYNMKLYQYEISTNPQIFVKSGKKIGGYSIVANISEVFDFDYNLIMGYFKQL